MPVDMKRLDSRKHFGLIAFVLCCFLLIVPVWSKAHEKTENKFSQIEEDIQCEWSGVGRIVAVGDLHGAIVEFQRILRGTDLVDENFHWIGGETHLVQIGDVLDRGDGSREIFDLIMRLEKEALAAGGRVHMLIGNHEEMNLADTAFDRQGYITVGQFKSFLPEKYVENQEKRFSRRTGRYPSENDTESPDFSEHWDELIQKGVGDATSAPRRQYYKNFIDLYGEWILSHNVVIKINDIVFVHGGISETFSTLELSFINSRFRIEMDDLVTAIMRFQMPSIPEYDRQIYNEPNGPLWYRGLATAPSADFEDDVIRILANLGANYIVMAHTPSTAVGREQMERYGGRVWIIDTGIAEYYQTIGGHVSALIYENGEFDVWYPEKDLDGSRSGEVVPPSPLRYFFFRLHPVFPSLKVVYYQPENKGGI